GGGFRQGPFSYTYTSGGGANPFDGTDFSDPFDIFEQFFGGGFGRATQQRQRRQVYQISIDFKDAMKGVTKEVHIPKGQAGEGSVKKTIKIPAGVDTGSRIRFDTFDIVIEVKPDKKYKRQGDDLILDKEILFSQAILGCVLEVETISKPVKIKIQQGTQPGTLIRLRGKGVPRLQRGGHGDQYVRIVIKIPSKISKKQKKLLEEFENDQ
ncbi:J domain-containing protein, partial [Patescibacteria group bacterium]